MSAALYNFTAVDKAGAKRRGVTRATSEADAFRRLSAQGLVPVSLKPQAPGFFTTRVSAKQIAEFTFQFSVLSSARIPLGDGLRSIAEQEKPGKLRTVIESVADRIEAGDSIAAALSEHAEVFGETFISTIRAAEQSGNLSKVLEYLADMLDRQEELRQNVKSAMMYPMIIIGVLSVAVTFLIGFVVPRFAKIFASRGVELPLLTQIMVSIGNFMQTWWWALLIGAGLLFFIIRGLLAQPQVRRAIDLLAHRIPFVRDILIATGVSRFARVFGLCLSSGLNLLDSLDLAGRSSGRAMLIEDIRTVSNQVRAGGRITAVMDACRYLPPFARRMIASGDEAAELPRMCAVIARQFERDAAVRSKRLSTVIEPLLVVAVAAIVLVVALSVFLPMWSSLGMMGN